MHRGYTGARARPSAGGGVADGCQVPRMTNAPRRPLPAGRRVLFWRGRALGGGHCACLVWAHGRGWLQRQRTALRAAGAGHTAMRLPLFNAGSAWRRAQAFTPPATATTAWQSARCSSTRCARATPEPPARARLLGVIIVAFESSLRAPLTLLVCRATPHALGAVLGERAGGGARHERGGHAHHRRRRRLPCGGRAAARARCGGGCAQVSTGCRAATRALRAAPAALYSSCTATSSSFFCALGVQSSTRV
jgi:hypothetical protein